MDQLVTAVLAEYEARAAAEARRTLVASVDDLLLPVGPITGRFLNELVKAMRASRVLEIGTSYGYSALWLAEAVRETRGELTTLELHARKSEHAREQLTRAGLAGAVRFVVGDALETLQTLPGPFDVVLIDLWKDQYVPIFDAVYPRLAPGAAVVADNMTHPVSTLHLARAYRQHVRAMPHISSVLLPLGSGIEVSRFKAP
jgi:predicted O-methyltransferase YrrM